MNGNICMSNKSNNDNECNLKYKRSFTKADKGCMEGFIVVINT